MYLWVPYILYFYAENAMEVNEDAVYAALRNRQACNPVFRALSRATLSYYRR